MIRQLIAALDRLAAAVEESNRAARVASLGAGRCMRMSPNVFGAEYRVSCVLPFAHPGAHTDGTSHWSRETDDQAPDDISSLKETL